jgi:hypothetical protein
MAGEQEGILIMGICKTRRRSFRHGAVAAGAVALNACAPKAGVNDTEVVKKRSTRKL